MQNKPTIERVQEAIPDAEIHKELGEGSYKVAYQATISGNKEALKIIQIPEDALDETVFETNQRRALREIDILGQCQSPYLVKLGVMQPKEIIIDSLRYICYSEELMLGTSLRGRVGNHSPALPELATIGACLLDVIIELENFPQPVIHRDIKPENIIVTASTERPFVLLDMGIAFVVGGTNLTLNPAVIHGTRYYIAPEMFNPNFRDSLDSRADIYTVGLTLYEYATGINPFRQREDNQYDTMVRILKDHPQPLNQLRTDLGPVFCELVDQMLSKLPPLRPGNTALLKRKMEGWK